MITVTCSTADRTILKAVGELFDKLATVTAPPVAVELDGDGLPWDPRINVDTKTKRQSDNSWKLKRNLDPALVASVKAELKALMGAPATITTPSPTTTPTPVAGIPATFGGLLSAFTFKQQQGKITADELNAICATHGVASLALIGSRPDLIPLVFSDMEALCLTRG